MKFDFSNISFLNHFGSNEKCAVPESISDAEKYVDTFLAQPMEESKKRDSITEFYSALKNRKAVLQYALTDDQKHNTPEKL